MHNVARDFSICAQYKAGKTLQRIADAFDLSKARVWQIVKKGELTKNDRKKADVRDEFLGVNLSEPVKMALRAETERRGVSMSEFTSELLVDMLRCCGYQLEAEQLENHEI